jgi:outer membrane protein TolC
MIFRRRHGILTCLPMVLATAGCALNPMPLTMEEIGANASDSLSRVSDVQEPVSGPIDLYEAMARALKYNLDHRVEMTEASLRSSEVRLAHFSLLPNVVANSGYADRDNVAASNSVNVLTGVESLATSTSQDQRLKTADVAFSWNILDFGLSYVRARQAADKYLIAEETRRKVAHRIIEDVRTAYWRAVSADRMLTRLRRLEGRVKRAQTNARSMVAEREASPITAATYERELVEIKRRILELQRGLSTAKTQLAALMNLQPGTDYHLVHPRRSASDLKLTMSVADMIWTAVENRAELRDVWYRKRINEKEMDAAILEALPGLHAYAGTNYDSNDFLFNNNWVNWGAKVSWNLIRLVQLPAKRDVIDSQEALLDARNLAVTMAVVTQVHVSRVRFYHLRRELDVAQEYMNAQSKLLTLVREEADAERTSEQTLVREEMNMLVAEVKRDIAYADLQNAYANVHASMGLDHGLESANDELAVDELAQQLRQQWVSDGDRVAGTRVTAAVD